MFEKIIKLNKDNGHNKYLSFFNDKIDLFFYNDWKQLSGSWNWLVFTFIHLEIERDIQCGKGNIDVMLFGLGFGIRWDWGKMNEELETRLKESMNEMKLIGWEINEIKKIFNLPEKTKRDEVIEFLKKIKKDYYKKV